MRCFFALDLPEPVREALAATAAELARVSRSVRCTAPDQLHVTLKFLGEIDQEKAAAMAAGLRALAVPSLRLSIGVLGRFPPHGPPRVLWAGLDGDDVAKVAAIAQQLDEVGERIGLPREERAFHPHVTLARVKWPDRTRELLQRLEGLAPAQAEPFLAPAVTFYRSELGPDGSRYSVLERVEPAPA